MKIDLDNVLATRAPGLHRLMPRAAVRALERMVCQEQLNDMLQRCQGRQGADFCQGVLEHLNITLDVRAPYGMPDPADHRVILASNHPLGGLDGMALIYYFSNYYGTAVKFIVNDLLMAVEPLQPVFLPINKHGSQSRQSLKAIDEAMAGDEPILVFPAGLVSRRQKGGVIADLEWQKMFVAKARKYQRTIIPLHFDGKNSDGFYRLAQWRKRLRIPVNIEMCRLPAEVFKARDSHFTITIGRPVDPALISDPTTSDAQKALAIRQLAYALAPGASQG